MKSCTQFSQIAVKTLRFSGLVAGAIHMNKCLNPDTQTSCYCSEIIRVQPTYFAVSYHIILIEYTCKSPKWNMDLFFVAFSLLLSLILLDRYLNVFHRFGFMDELK